MFLSHVNVKLALRGERPVAQVANMRLLAGVGSDVIPESCSAGEALVALVASEWLFSSVDAHVDVQVLLLRELLSTTRAHKWLLSWNDGGRRVQMRSNGN